MKSGLDLADLAASRLCHDLVSPAGAIATGLELLADGSDLDEEALALIRQSSRQLNARLAFFRLAFGRAESGNIPIGEVRRILEDYHNENLTYEWHDPIDFPVAAMPRYAARILLLTTMVAQSAILRTSALSTRIAGVAGGLALGVLAEGQSGRMGNDCRLVLEGEFNAELVSPALLPALYLRTCCDEDGGQIQFEASDGVTEIAVLCSL